MENGVNRSRYLYVDYTNNNSMTEFKMDTIKIKTSTPGNKFQWFARLVLGENSLDRMWKKNNQKTV